MRTGNFSLSHISLAKCYSRIKNIARRVILIGARWHRNERIGVDESHLEGKQSLIDRSMTLKLIFQEQSKAVAIVRLLHNQRSVSAVDLRRMLLLLFIPVIIKLRSFDDLLPRPWNVTVIVPSRTAIVRVQRTKSLQHWHAVNDASTSLILLDCFGDFRSRTHSALARVYCTSYHLIRVDMRALEKTVRCLVRDIEQRVGESRVHRRIYRIGDITHYQWTLLSRQ